MPGVFVDVASLWGLDDTAGGPVGADAVDDALHIRASVGLSLDYRSDFGTFQLSIAHPIKQMDYDRGAPLNFAFFERVIEQLQPLFQSVPPRPGGCSSRERIPCHRVKRLPSAAV